MKNGVSLAAFPQGLEPAQSAGACSRRGEEADFGAQYTLALVTSSTNGSRGDAWILLGTLGTPRLRLGGWANAEVPVNFKPAEPKGGLKLRGWGESVPDTKQKSILESFGYRAVDLKGSLLVHV